MRTNLLPPATMRFDAISRNIFSATTPAHVDGITQWMINSELDYGDEVWCWYGARLIELLTAKERLIRELSAFTNAHQVA